MSRRYIKPVLTLTVCLAFVVPLAAQTHEFGSWIGVAAGTPTLVGKTEQVSLFMTAIRYSRIFSQRPEFNLRYTLDVIPILRLSHGLETAYGRGAAPIGFEMSFRPGKRVEPTASIRGGFIYFDDDVPETEGRRLNFTADLGFGLRMHLGQSAAVHGGYKYHHLSNAYRAPANPGFDSNLLFVGASFRR